jgi:uncharacterized protein (TIGR02996 family)
MTQEEAFLQAIIESPDDDSLRLIYADWLEERGNPRGEFIRAQCQLANLPEGDPRRPELQAREQELLAKYSLVWIQQLHLDPSSVTFRRGFVDEAQVNADFLLGDQAELFRLTPLRHLLVQGYQGNQLGREGTRTVASWPQLARLQSLRLPENWVADAGAKALAASPHVGSLLLLDLGNNHIGEAGATALAASVHLAKLMELFLDYNYIGVAGARALARSPYLTNLTLLDLEHDFFIGSEGEEGEAEAVEELEARFGDRVNF